MSRRPATIDLDLRPLGAGDIGVVDALARLQLVAGRHGVRLRIVAAPDLAGLIELAGLAVVLGLAPTSARERRWQPEERDGAGPVEDEGDPGDRAP